MKNDTPRTEYITRDTLLRLLSDEEIARVSTAETAKNLTPGELYVDLAAPGRGVLRADESQVIMGHILPQSALRPKTWRDIVIVLEAHGKEGESLPPRV